MCYQLKQIVSLFTVSIAIFSCSSDTALSPLPEEVIPPAVPIPIKTLFFSSDLALENIYNWAEKMALRYSHSGNDPVGYWYEAALPGRQAFCMRDVSHQTVGGEILGLSKHNLNMLTRFAENISESKDWCSYWEINRNNRPAPADYNNDKEFWYNLNANFDLIQACLKMYQWTGNHIYLDDSRFTNFYEKSLNQYVQRWKLAPEDFMNRPLYMNTPPNFNPDNPFHSCRGLASYVENFEGLTASADLLAAIYAGYNAYVEICDLKGNTQIGEEYRSTALRYRELLENRWWDSQNNRYHNFWTINKDFRFGEGSSYILWFNATENPDRIRHTVTRLISQNWNVETQSYFPAMFYRLGYWEYAYKILTSLHKQDRSDYPEVSFGTIEGIVGGVMGIQPTAYERQIRTLSRLTKESDYTDLRNLPMFEGFISVKHDGRQSSRLENKTGKSIQWRASFPGIHNSIYSDKEKIEATISTDIMGNSVSYIDIEIPNGDTSKAYVQ